MGNQVENLPRDGAVVAVFDTHTAARAALDALVGWGLSADRVSLVGKDARSEGHLVAFYDGGESTKVWGRLGGFWGDVAGTLTGSAFLVLPEVGHLLVFGPLGHWIMAGLEGAAVIGGVSALGAGLVSLGVPRGDIAQYESSVRAGRFLVVASGTSADVERARGLLRRARPVQCHDYHRAPALAS